MKKYILASILAAFAISCSDYKYPSDKEVSETNGARIDSTTSFLLDNIEFGGSTYSFDWNKERRAAVDDYYTFTSEGLLYNYYQKRNIYRFLFEKEGKAPLIVSINEDGARSWIVSKLVFEREEIAPACGINLVRDYTPYSKDLTGEQVAEFKTILSQINFFNLATTEANQDLKNYCLIEVHEKDKYWTVYRPLSDAELQPLVEYVSKLSRFNYDTDRVSKLPEMSMP